MHSSNHESHSSEATACLGCASSERRAYLLTLSPDAATALDELVRRYADKAIAEVGDGVMVDIREDAIVAEIITREAQRLHAGGKLRKFTWRTAVLKGRKNSRKKARVSNG